MPLTRFEPGNGALLLMPDGCANCASRATESHRCGRGGRSIGEERRAALVPYCSRCYRSLERSKTRLAVGIAAAVLLGLTTFLVLPWSGFDLSLTSYTAWVLAASLLPVAVLSCVTATPQQEQTTGEVAVWWAGSALVGTNEAWMRQLASANQGQLTSHSGRTPVLVAGVWVVPATAGVLALSAYGVFFPTVLVLNLSPTEFELVVDGTPRGQIGVTSLESVDAGLRITVGAGRHIFAARSVADGTLVAEVEAAVDAGHLYLFAPASHDYCFWSERDGYGQAADERKVRRLGGKDGFFVLPDRVDTWFASNPPFGEDLRSSGGEMVAVRHGRCLEVPLKAR